MVALASTLFFSCWELGDLRYSSASVTSPSPQNRSKNFCLVVCAFVFCFFVLFRTTDGFAYPSLSSCSMVLLYVSEVVTVATEIVKLTSYEIEG